MSNTKKLRPSEEKKLRNHEIYLEIATGVSKDVVCKTFGISVTQLNRILKDAKEETNEWYKSLPRRYMIHIFRRNYTTVFKEIQRLEQIRNEIKDDKKTEFEMTLKMINAYSNYNKMIADGPTLTRQKEIIEAAEKLLESQSK